MKCDIKCSQYTTSPLQTTPLEFHVILDVNDNNLNYITRFEKAILELRSNKILRMSRIWVDVLLHCKFNEHFLGFIKHLRKNIVFVSLALLRSDIQSLNIRNTKKFFNGIVIDLDLEKIDEKQFFYHIKDVFSSTPRNISLHLVPKNVFEIEDFFKKESQNFQ